jgi:hypothetical protein
MPMFRRAAFAAPGLLLQFLDLFRRFRFGPIFVVFFPRLRGRASGGHGLTQMLNTTSSRDQNASTVTSPLREIFAMNGGFCF